MYDEKKSEFRSVVGMAVAFASLAGGVVLGVTSVIYRDAAVYVAIISGLVMAISIIGLYLMGFKKVESLSLVFIWSFGTLLAFLGFWCAVVEQSVAGSLIALGVAFVWIAVMCVPVTKNLCIDRKARKNKSDGE